VSHAGKARPLSPAAPRRRQSVTFAAPTPESLRFVADLMSLMTLEEKLGQLDLFHPADDPTLEAEVRAGRIGGIALRGPDPRWQPLAIQQSRLGIPLLLTAAESPPAMNPWALASSWDEALAARLGAEAARRALESGCNAFLAPGLDDRPGEPAAGQQIVASEPHLGARLARAFCLGAAPGPPALESSALAIPRCGHADASSGRATALELAHLGGPVAIDCEGLTALQAARAGFAGILVAECARIRAMIAQRFATTRARSRLETAESLLADRSLAEGDIDAAVRGVLNAKHALGLFREPLRRRTPPPAADQGLGEPARAERAGMVLLRNEAGLLPFSPVSDRVLVVGAADGVAGRCAEALARAGIGNATAPGLAVRRHGESLVEPVAGDRFSLALTHDAAKRADFVIVALEDRHFAPGPAGGWPSPGPAVLALLRALASAGPRVVALIATAQPVDLGDADEHFAAILQCWTPGKGFEEALGDILSGRAGPSARMPTAAGRFAFGQGLSFGETVFTGLTLAEADARVRASVRVRNAGAFPAREVVQLYCRDGESGLRLAAFQHVDLAAGAEEIVTFTLGLEALGTQGESGRRELAPGWCEIFVGKDQRRLLSATIEINPGLARAIVNRDRGLLRLAG
jgi:beta-glucosidase